MNVRKMTSINFDTPSMKVFDWGLAAASVGYGLYSWSSLWLVAGLIGGLAAWYRPLSRLQRYLNAFVKNRH